MGRVGLKSQNGLEEYVYAEGYNPRNGGHPAALQLVQHLWDLKTSGALDAVRFAGFFWDFSAQLPLMAFFLRCFFVLVAL